MSAIQSVKEIKVGIDFGCGVQPAGRLAIHDRQIYFEYDREFVEQGLEISPFHLPLKSGLFPPFELDLFEGLPGVFNDSLPDGWGRLLFDRFARQHDILPADITPLDRLAHAGRHALGALVFEPDHSADETKQYLNLNSLAAQMQAVLGGAADDVLAELITLNGSSAGARPKALIGVSEARDHIIHGARNLPDSHTPWLVKFPNSQDGLDAGAIEYVYARMAINAGIAMPDVHLFAAKAGGGYFAAKRFDREGRNRHHMHTACGLLHSDFRAPSLDYAELLALTQALTRDVREVEKMYRLAAFNVLAHNRDDHSKNFSFLMDHEGQWALSPAYDLTFSSGPNGEQSTTVLGEGRSPGVAHLLDLAEEAGLAKKRATEIIEATTASLAEWPTLAKQHGVRQANIDLIERRLRLVQNVAAA